MDGKVRIQRPRNFRNRATPFIAPRYSVARDDQIPRNSVQSVLHAFAPIETPPSRNGDISSRTQRQCRFETNRIARPEKLRASPILTTLKQGVKGSEIRTRSVPVPTRNVEVNLDAGVSVHSVPWLGHIGTAINSSAGRSGEGSDGVDAWRIRDVPVDFRNVQHIQANILHLQSSPLLSLSGAVPVRSDPSKEAYPTMRKPCSAADGTSHQIALKLSIARSTIFSTSRALRMAAFSLPRRAASFKETIS